MFPISKPAVTFSGILSSSIIKWNKLDRDVYNSDSLNIFKLLLLKFIRPVANGAFNINIVYGSKLLTRLSLDLSHLPYHKFRQNV